jgi:hypothetical protein
MSSHMVRGQVTPSQVQHAEGAVAHPAPAPGADQDQDETSNHEEHEQGVDDQNRIGDHRSPGRGSPDARGRDGSVLHSLHEPG